MREKMLPVFFGCVSFLAPVVKALAKWDSKAFDLSSRWFLDYRSILDVNGLKAILSTDFSFSCTQQLFTKIFEFAGKTGMHDKSGSTGNVRFSNCT